MQTSFKMFGIKLSVIAAVFAALSSLSLGVHVSPVSCRQNYQDALNEAIRIWGECGTAAFYDCCQVKQVASFLQSGKYDIGEACEPGHFVEPRNMLARCDMESDGGGWLVIQRRANNTSINFTRNWRDYEEGFGDLDSEFWYGLKNIHCLTTRDDVELRIDMEDESGNKTTWVYQQFRVAGLEHQYRLTIGKGEGTTGTTDAMATHNEQHFSTFDHDNDAWSDGNCAQVEEGGWWYNSCSHANLNGIHDGSGYERILWYNSNTDQWIVYPYVEMKIRCKTCSFERPCPDTE